MKLIFFVFLMGLSFGFFAGGIYRCIRYIRLGRRERRSDQPLKRWQYLFRQVILHEKIRNKPVFAVFHILLMSSFVVLIISGMDMAAEGLKFQAFSWLGSNPAFLGLRDTFLMLGLVGVAGCVVRRLVYKPGWLKSTWVEWSILVMIGAIILSETLYYALLYAQVGDSGSSTAWFTVFLGKGVEQLSLSESGLAAARAGLWWLHYGVMAALMVYLPRSKHLHLLLAFFNTYFHSLAPKGDMAFTGLPLQGVRVMEDFSWKQLLDGFSCVKCGRCNGVCPSKLSGDKMKPKPLSGRLRKHVETRGPLLLKGNLSEKNREILERDMTGEVYKPDYLWACTTCGACAQACPVSVEHLAKVIGMRRYLLSENKSLPLPIAEMSERMAEQGSPWGTPYLGRENWGLPLLGDTPDCEVVIYPGCAPYYDPQARQTLQSLVKILRVAGIKGAILEQEKRCCGEGMRRIGGEEMYQAVIKDNIGHWQSAGLSSKPWLLTLCPHCYNALKKEYPAYGGDYQVISHVVFIAKLFKEGRLKSNRPKDKAIRITYQDPCYLARYNNIHDEVREIVHTLPGLELLEMPHHREETFCCGGGGGRFWSKNDGGNAIARRRLSDAVQTQSEILCTSCPYCQGVLEREWESQSENQSGRQAQAVRIVDIVEVVKEQLMID